MELKILKEPVTQVDTVFLDNFRFSNGRGLPLSYREFAKKYGYGLLCNLFLIYVPLRKYCDSWSNQTKILKHTFNEFISNNWYLTLKPDGDETLIKNAVPFGKSENGDFLFWNILSEPQRDEFEIYITDFGGMGVLKIADSIDEFIESITANKLQPKISAIINHSLPAVFHPIKIVDNE